MPSNTPEQCCSSSDTQLLLSRSSNTPQIMFKNTAEKNEKYLPVIDEKGFGDSAIFQNFPVNTRKNVKSKLYENKTYCDNDSDSQSDFDAMSIASLYKSGENLEDEMDTQVDFVGDPVAIQDNLNGDPVNGNTSQSKDASNHKCCDCYHSSYNSKSSAKIHFRDGIRSVDYVLVWDALNQHALSLEGYDKRQMFESNLRKEGLQIEYESEDPCGLNFIKIHVPKEVLRRYSEILKLRMPMKEALCPESEEKQKSNLFTNIGQKIPAFRQISRQTNFLIDGINRNWDKIRNYVFVDEDNFPDKGRRFTAIYSRDREYLFDVDSPNFFTPAIRSRIVQFILDRKRYSDNSKDDFAFGIERLLNEKIYAAGYPLHDGDLKTPGSMRNLLYTEWASLRKWYRYQPLDYVKEYFGVKIGLYFAWLGFYTNMLIPAAIVGLACFIYSCATLYTNIPSEDICHQKITDKMCPLCDIWCGYWNISESCFHARITYLFDNSTTVFFAIFMSIWATLFMELWKRNSAEITHRWDLTGFDIQEEHPRPQYLARLAHVKQKQVNVVTNTLEPKVPFWKLRVPMTILSFSVVLLLVTLALATVVAVVLYRMSVLVALKAFNKKSGIFGDNSSVMLFTTSTAACINLVFIVIFNYMYTFVAEYLTEYELLRTQTEFDDSLTLKIYLLQFVNYYASIFYIAFFKGRFVGYPKEYNTVFGFRQEECGPGGCLMELCIQLAIIMVGKQTMNAILEMFSPLILKWWKTMKVKSSLKEKQSCKNCRPQWIPDYKLVNWGPMSLFPEYLEMVLQYGFVTIFVAAFPLAPFFALLNNFFEMRLDAKKLLTFHRRPVSQRVSDIGVWFRILDTIGKLSVITNGFIIAFTSDFIPRAVHLTTHDSLENYLNSSLSYFHTKDFHNSSKPRNWESETTCRYPDYREPAGYPNEYDRTALYWKILAARLLFVVIFENIVVLVCIIVKYLIPDIPGDLKDKMRREAYITNEIIIKQEMSRSQLGVMGLSPTELEKLKNIDDAPASPEQWDRLLSKSFESIPCQTDCCEKPNSPISV